MAQSRPRIQKAVWSEFFDDYLVKFYQENPIAFIEDLIFHKNTQYFLSDQQIRFINSVLDNKRTTVVGGRGTGKDCALALIIIWWLCCFRPSKVCILGPTMSQLESVIWAEIAKWLNISLVKDLFYQGSRKMQCLGDGTPGESKYWWAEIRTANKEESLLGLHSPHLLIIADESPGIADEIYTAAIGSLTEHKNKFVAVGNGTRTSGWFFDSHHTHKNRWSRISLNSEESPFVSKEFIEDMEARYGRDHDLFKVHVLGQFPSGDPQAFIALSDVTEATYREVQKGFPIEIGVDVAREGDDLTVLCWREGNYVHPLITAGGLKIPQTTEKTLELVRTIREETGYKGTIRVKVDCDGLGVGVYDELCLDRKHNIDPIECHFSGAGDQVCENEATIMWKTIRDNIGEMHLPSDQFLIAELSSRRKEESGRTGRVMIESKKKYKKDFGGKSPDRADALVLCFSGKENVRTVIKGFDPLDSCVVKSANDVYGSHFQTGKKYCSLFYTKDNLPFVTWAVWRGNKLHFIKEATDKSINELAREISYNGPYHKVLGNDVMFKRGKDDLQSQFCEYGIFIEESYNMDEYGSIAMLTKLIDAKDIVILNNCQNVIKHLKTWKLDANRRDIEETYGFCYSVLGIISDLRKEFEAPPPVQRIPYLQSVEEFNGEKRRVRDNSGYLCT